MGPKEKLIERYRPNIEDVLTNWAFVPNSPERNIKLAEIIAWIKNFKPSEIEYAIKIMESIQYYDDNSIRSIIGNLSCKVQAIFGDELKDVLFFPLGNSSASSGSMYLYQYRKELRLSENNFKQDGFEKYLSKNTNIVFFDDIIGSGNQATTFFNEHLSNKPAKCYYFSLLGLQDGISKINKEAGFEATIVGEILTDEQMAFSENSCVFTGKERDIIKPICEKYGDQLFKKYPLGYDDTQALIVFPHNTPNNTLPIIWASNDNETSTAKILWSPLWNRKKTQNKNPQKTKGAFTDSNSFFDIVTKECYMIREKISSYTHNIEVIEEQNSDSISYDIQFNSDIIFFKIARNIFFDANKSVLVWLYKNKRTSEDASFNAIVEQHTEGIKVMNLGAFLGKEELEICFSSMEDFMKELFNEINSFIQHNYA
jgi:orotate phosphoribosyltransferase-like protein